jgi:hypothetical protein
MQCAYIFVFFWGVFDPIQQDLWKADSVSASQDIHQHLWNTTENTAVRIRLADHATPLYPQKLALTSPTCGVRWVGIVRSRTKTTELL